VKGQGGGLGWRVIGLGEGETHCALVIVDSSASLSTVRIRAPGGFRCRWVVVEVASREEDDGRDRGIAMLCK
jgi:hypothetical protein